MKNKLKSLEKMEQNNNYNLEFRNKKCYFIVDNYLDKSGFKYHPIFVYDLAFICAFSVLKMDNFINNVKITILIKLNFIHMIIYK